MLGIEEKTGKVVRTVLLVEETISSHPRVLNVKLGHFNYGQKKVHPCEPRLMIVYWRVSLLT